MSQEEFPRIRRLLLITVTLFCVCSLLFNSAYASCTLSLDQCSSKEAQSPSKRWNHHESAWKHHASELTARYGAYGGSPGRIEYTPETYAFMNYFAAMQRAALVAQGWSEAWFTPAAQDVHSRCRVINFLNRDIKAQANPPSPLPDNFKDCFDMQDWWLTRHRLKRYSVEEAAELIGSEVGYPAGALHSVSLPQGAKAKMRASMRNWGRYRYWPYREALKMLSVYEEYMLEIAAQVEHDREFQDKLATIQDFDIATFLLSEKRRIEQLQAERKRQKECAEQQATLHKLHTEQMKRLSEQSLCWDTHHAERAAAYAAMKQHPSLQEQQQYHFSIATQEAIQQLKGTVPLFQQKSFVVTGHALQHELAHEIIIELDRWAQVHLPVDTAPLNGALHRDSLMILENAHMSNTIGDCASSAQLIDLSSIIIDYCWAVGEGLYTGTVDAVIAPLTMMLHPLETAQHLGRLVYRLVECISNYMPPEMPEFPTQAELENYYTHCQAVALRHTDAAQAFKQFLTNRPTPEQIRSFVSTTAHLTANLLMPHACGTVIGTLADCACTPLVVNSAAAVTAPALKAVNATRLAQYILKQAQRVKSGVKLIEAHCEEFVRSYLPSRRQAIVLHTDAHTAGVATQRLNSVHATATESSTPVGSLKKRKLNKNHNALKAAEELAARNGAPVGILGKLSESQLEKAVTFAMSDPNKMEHVFAKKHQFEELVKHVGTEKECVRAMVEAAEGKLPAVGLFEDIEVIIDDHTICMSGYVIEGVPRIGTAFPTIVNGKVVPKPGKT